MIFPFTSKSSTTVPRPMTRTGEFPIPDIVPSIGLYSLKSFRFGQICEVVAESNIQSSLPKSCPTAAQVMYATSFNDAFMSSSLSFVWWALSFLFRGGPLEFRDGPCPSFPPPRPQQFSFVWPILLQFRHSMFLLGLLSRLSRFSRVFLACIVVPAFARSSLPFRLLNSSINIDINS